MPIGGGNTPGLFGRHAPNPVGTTRLGFTPTTRTEFGAPFAGSAARSFELAPDLFGALSGGADIRPPRVGDQRRRPAPFRGFESTSFADTLNFFTDDSRGTSLADTFRANAETDAGRAALSAFFDTPLSEAETARTAEGERALSERAFTEFLLAHLGLGPGAGSTAGEFRLQGSGEGELRGFLHPDAGFNPSQPGDIDRFLDTFESRGLASAEQGRRVREGTFRAFSTERIASQDIDNLGVVRTVPLAGSGEADDLLFAQDFINVGRQKEFGIQTSDYGRTTDGAARLDPPLDVALIRNRDKRSRRAQISSAARGRRNPLGKGSDRGLLNDSTITGATTLGGQ